MKRRSNLEPAEEVRQRLDDLRDGTDAESLSEMIRRSVTFHDPMVRGKRAGSKVLIETPDGQTRQLEFL